MQNQARFEFIPRHNPHTLCAQQVGRSCPETRVYFMPSWAEGPK